MKNQIALVEMLLEALKDLEEFNQNNPRWIYSNPLAARVKRLRIEVYKELTKLFK